MDVLILALMASPLLVIFILLMRIIFKSCESYEQTILDCATKKKSTAQSQYDQDFDLALRSLNKQFPGAE